MALASITTIPSASTPIRIMGSMVGQGLKTISCPPTPDLRGKRVLITGGASGVGEFVARGCIARGANVTSLARGQSKSSGKLDGLQHLKGDLSDPMSVLDAVDQCTDAAWDLLIFNAGINSGRYSQTALGLERTYAVNVFGHQLLFSALHRKGLVKPGARIVFTTGDIYALANDCTANYKYRAGPMAYARSKLGNLWQALEMTRRYPNLHPIAVHPGVVASGFAGSKSGPIGWLKNRVFISEEVGAQSALIAATQDLDPGAYWHNVFGRVDLAETDIANDTEKSGKFWENLDTLVQDVLNG